ncbi:MAG: GFA family protein [Steroidobacteraceae bacterium]|nr:GFA family protein [Steroidobacteraceae bacterium]MCW5571474.1 GFA family protein [Steroidobacteraceae bacterium]
MTTTLAEMAQAGGCRCGRVRYRVAGPARECFFCHCTSCRRSAGASPVPWVTFGAAGFGLVDGEPAEYASSRQVLRSFCRHCGTALTYRHSAFPDEIDVMTLSLDEPAPFAPRHHLWVGERLPWIVIGDDLPRYAADRE